MRRRPLRLGRRLKLALAGLVGGFAFACGGPTNPGEMPPMAPRPDPVQPVPDHRPSDPSPTPVPGAPDPLDPSRTGPTNPAPADAGVPVTEIAPVQFQHDDGTPSDGGAPPSEDRDPPPTDASVDMDASAPLPPIPDALPPDAPRRTP